MAQQTNTTINNHNNNTNNNNNSNNNNNPGLNGQSGSQLVLRAEHAVNLNLQIPSLPSIESELQGCWIKCKNMLKFCNVQTHNLLQHTNCCQAKPENIAGR
jgi:hypothetical protein